METLTQDELVKALKAAMDAARRETPEEMKSYWYYRPDDDFPPRTTVEPDDYNGSERLSIACTQTELSARAQRELVERWRKALPTFSAVSHVWFWSKVPQGLFDAACEIAGLEGLYVKWSGIQTVEPVAELARLKYLHIGSSPGVRSILPLSRLRNLCWLEVDNFRDITDLSPLEALTQLDGLGFTGAEGARHTVKSFAPLGSLTNLKWLHLGAVYTEDGLLRGLAPLKKLKWMGLGKFFSWEEFAWLSAHLPSANCPWLQPLSESFGSCKKCGANQVWLSGKGMPRLCPKCDEKRIRQFVEEFQGVAWRELR